MSAQLINGVTIAQAIHEETATEIIAIMEQKNIRPSLAVILVGDDPASSVYVSRKEKKCNELGILSKKIVLPADTKEEDLLAIIRDLNQDSTIHGILVQSPVPKQIDEQKVVLTIDPRKDVDCFHPFNAGRILLGDFTGFLPCTPWGITVLLERSGISISGKRVAILGRSNIVGRPLAAMLSAKAPFGDATVTLCHSRTRELESVTKEADIVIAALGIPQFLHGEQIKDGATVIDVGINRIADPAAKKGYRIVGDADFDSVSQKAAFLTPVPGGVGPMTIAMLMKNAVHACRAALFS